MKRAVKVVAAMAILALSGMGKPHRAEAQPCPPGSQPVVEHMPGSRFVTICQIIQPPSPGPEPPPGSPPACPVIWTEVRPHQQDLCYLITYERDCQGHVRERSREQVPCPSPSPGPARFPCVDENGNPLISIGPDGITCGRAGQIWRIEASVRFPEVILDVRPYPATLVGWPTAIRLTGAPPAEGSGTLGYVPLGGGTFENPRPGDWRNVRLTLRLVPMGTCQVYLPNARGPMRTLQRPASPLPLHETFWLPAAGPYAQPTYIYWEVPSHPAAGNTFLDPGLNARVGLPGDFPAFRGSARAPYVLQWSFEWEEYKEEINKYCDDRSPAGDECDSNGDGIKDRKWRWETRRWWESKSEGGVVDPAAIPGAPPDLLADLNGDGRPEALWNRKIVIRRMAENDQPARGPLAFRIELDGLFPFWVREAQGQIGWPR